MTLLFWPFMTRLDWQKISTLIIVRRVLDDVEGDLLN
jgi:hypothetical protein